MNMNAKLFSLLLLQSISALLVQATIYIVHPLTGVTCSGGQSCTVEWLDNGVLPVLSDIGVCHVGLYYGAAQLIQQIDPVDVSAQHSLTFTPDPQAGPNAAFYYINFTSVNVVDGSIYNQYSTMFTLDNMSGALASPVASDTKAIPVPSSLLSVSSLSSVDAVPTSSLTVPVNSPSVHPPSATVSSTSSGGGSTSASTTATQSSGSSTSTSTSGGASSTSSTPSSSSNTSSSVSATSSSTISSSSGFITMTSATTLTVPPSSETSTPASSVSTAPAASSSSASASAGSTNQSSSNVRAASMPLFLSSVVVLAFGFLM